ncbi:AI-2E family transporter [Methylocella silvestris]|uniref:AI-2E family transporter n=1 Tax=Methylocella silvestris TaxID=199596 RepID=A0A2J7TE20_METSI|nr:AI-2E family transporter [Methylocella silvestris]PNG25014.1 AI-2E family transporter [Methylocella silvestris]
MDSSVTRVASAMIIAFLVIGALYFADAVFEPVAFALFFIAIVWPLQKTLETKIPSGLALIVTVLVTLVVVIKLTSMIAWSGSQIGHWLSVNFDRLQALYFAYAKWLEEHDIYIATVIADRFNVLWLLRLFQTVALRLNSLIGFSLLIFIFLAMGLLEAEAFSKNLRAVGGETGERLIAAGKATARKFRRYMLVRTAASILTGLIVWGFATLVGLELAAAWGVISFALNYIPFIGPLIATVLPTLFGFAQTGSWETAVFILVALTVVQFLIGSYFEPLFTAKTLSISPFVVIFAVFLWGFIWGLPGTFIGVPILIACLTVCEQFASSRWLAVLLSGKVKDDAPAAG